ncbi:MAG: hypothetical protein RLZZ244_2979 [Verrucomicrobiota bacterium]
MKRWMLPCFALALWVYSPEAEAEPASPQIQEPRDGEQTIVFCPHFAWDPPAGEWNCEIEIARDASFHEIVDRDVIPALSGWYVCAERLAPGGYFWRIRFQEANGQAGAWTGVRRLDVVEPRRTLRVSPEMTEPERNAVFQDLQKDPHSVRLVFEKGVYRFTPGQEQSVMVVKNGRDVLIEGNGSRLINGEPSAKLWNVVDSGNVVITDLSYEYDPYPASYARVLAIDAEAGSMDAEVIDGFDQERYPRMVNQMFCYALNPANRRQLHPDRPGHTYLAPDKTQKIAEHRYRYFAREDGEKRSLGMLQAGDEVLIPYRRWPVGMVARCDNFLFRNVVTHGAEGSVFMGGGNKDMKFIGYVSRPSREPLPGNAWVSGNDRRGPWIEHCLFEALSDDGPNMTGNLYLIESQPSSKSFQLDTGPGYQDALWKPGDELLFWNPTTGQVLMETRIAEVLAEKPGHGKKTITTVDTPTGLNPGTDMRQHTHVYNLSCQNTGFVARNNRFVDGRRFGLNVKAINSVIEKNHFEGLSSSAIYIENEPTGWEGIVGRNMVVQDNSITRCGFGRDISGLKRGAIQVNLWRVRQPGERDHESPWLGHRNIVIRNNVLTDWETYGIAVDNVEGCRIENNELANRLNTSFAKKTNIGIWVRSVTKGVVLKENRMTDRRVFEPIRIEPSALGEAKTPANP